MIVNNKISRFYLLASIALITIGFIVMKAENAAYGYGPLALTVAPLLILAGYLLGILSIFHGKISIVRWKNQLPFLVAGWATFFISFSVYLITLEETASLWDCAEFIACAYKLQIPHAPGAPLFLMIGRVFSMFALGDTLKVAYWINVVSALSSAFAVMFTFWSVVMLGKRINAKASKFSLVVSGLVGAFVIAFADSFWFSAVEAESYAMATMFLSICFWAILKWDREIDLHQRDKWLIFIFYTLGLSIGVHPMSLLVLPAIVLIIIFHFHGFSWKNLVLGTVAGGLSILFLNQVVLFGLPDIMKYADILFVNGLGLPFYSGAVTSLIVLNVVGFFGYTWSTKTHQKILTIFIVGMMYFLMGYASYFMIIIRSQANPSIDENNPENIISLASYLKRESYGTRPFLYGPTFTSKVKSYKEGSSIYAKGKDAYEIVDHETEYKYDREDQMIFPRMYSNQQSHISTYREWAGLRDGAKPTFMDNLAFLVKYQLGHMYLRYLMFNFSGRESDVQHATWLNPFDAFKKIPDVLNNNKARNNFLMLPFLLGILGMFFQYKNDKAGFWVNMAYFLFLGLILVFYLNSTPNEPRERDYIYVGSYVAFAIWCGMGAMGICSFLEEKSTEYPWIRFAGALVILVPTLMLIVGFDDHNRSGRTLQVDHARNTLDSCAPNAILFTGGDNDTFPLWYVQEVEGFRTDVRVIVLSYFNASWYIDQMKRKVYASDALPISLESRQYQQGGLNDILPFVENPGIKGAINLDRFLDLLRTENKAFRVSVSGNTKYNSIPSRTFVLDVDTKKVCEKMLVPAEFRDTVVEKMEISWKGNYMEKSAFLVLDLIAANRWNRPIYFNLTSLNSISLNLKKHVLQEGLVYRLLPIELKTEGTINSKRMFENLMIKAVYHDLENENVYYNHEDYQLRILQTMKSNYNDLARQLINNHEETKAIEVVDFVNSKLNGKNKQTDLASLQLAELLFILNEKKQAEKLADILYENANQMLEYQRDHGNLNSADAQIQFYILKHLQEVATKYEYVELAEKCSNAFNQYFSAL